MRNIKEQERPRKHRRRRVITFGDSTTATRPTIERVYAQRLASKLQTADIGADIINEGVPGSHTGSITDNARHKGSHGSDRFEKNVLGMDPDVVIICFGLNDSWVDGDSSKDNSRVPLAAYSRNIRYFVESLEERKVRVILMTPNAIGSRFETWRFERVSNYAEAIREIAQEKAVPLVDVWNMFLDYAATSDNDVDDLMLDSMHPNDKAHEMIAERLTAIIADLWRTPSSFLR